MRLLLSIDRHHGPWLGIRPRTNTLLYYYTTPILYIILYNILLCYYTTIQYPRDPLDIVRNRHIGRSLLLDGVRAAAEDDIIEDAQ